MLTGSSYSSRSSTVGSRAVDLLERREPLHRHLLEVAVRHRVAHERDLQPVVEQDPPDLAARLALAAAGAHGGHRDDRLRGLEHRRARPEQAEVRARGEHERGLVHHRLVREVRVGEHDLVDLFAADQLRQLLLGPDRNAVRVQRPGERGRVEAVGDPGDLGRREGDDADIGVLAEGEVEVVEVAPSGTHDDDPAHRMLLSVRRLRLIVTRSGAPPGRRSRARRRPLRFAADYLEEGRAWRAAGGLERSRARAAATCSRAPPGPGVGRAPGSAGGSNVPSRTCAATCSCASRNGTPSPDERLGGVGREQQRVGARRGQAVVVELEPGDQHAERRERERRVAAGVEDGPLVLLQVAVVGERQALHHREQAREAADRGAGLAADELGDVGVQLLRHHRRAGRGRLGQAREAELARRSRARAPRRSARGA